MASIQLDHDLGHYNFDNNSKATTKMITEKIGTHDVVRLDDIEQLTVNKFNNFNLYALYDSEVGFDMPAVVRNFQKIDSFITSKKPEDAVQARNNLLQTFSHIFQGNNFPALQWCSLLHSVDGVEVKDNSIDNFKKIISTLSDAGLTQAKVRADVEAAKKKFVPN